MLIASLVNLLIYIVVIGLIVGLIYWAADAIPLPDPFNRVVKVLVIVIAVLILILLLLQLAGVARVDMLPLERPAAG